MSLLFSDDLLEMCYVIRKVWGTDDSEILNSKSSIDLMGSLSILAKLGDMRESMHILFPEYKFDKKR